MESNFKIAEILESVDLLITDKKYAQNIKNIVNKNPGIKFIGSGT